MHISVVTVYVNDVKRALDFYTNTLGFKVVTDAAMGEDHRWLTVVPPGEKTQILLCKNFAGWSTDKVGQDTGYIVEVDDVFKTHEQWKARGVQFEDEPSMEFFGGWARFKDSEGNVFGLHSPARQSATGSNSQPSASQSQ